jgi:hypothetical protein
VFWEEGLPLEVGTNAVRLLATNAAGQVSSTNLSVVKSDVLLTIDSTPEGESLYEAFGVVSGTVSYPGYVVTVNGKAATVGACGYWTAVAVPVLGRGTATFDAVAASSGGGGGAPPVATSVAPELPAMIVIMKHFSKYTSRAKYAGQSGTQVRTKNYDAQFAPGMDGQWRRSYQATVTNDNTVGVSSSQTDYHWSHTNTAGTQHDVSDGVDYPPTQMDGTYYNDVLVKYVPDKSLDHEDYTPGYNTPIRYLVTHFWATGVKHRWDYTGGDFTEETLKARTDLKLFTGGKAKVARKSLIHISASAVEYGRPGGVPWYQTPGTSVAAARIQMFGWWLFGRQNPDPNGDLYLALPDNAAKNLNLRVKGAKHYDATVNVIRHDLLHETVCRALTDPNLARTQLGVGEYVNCWFEPGNFPTNGVWSVSAGGLDMTTGNAVWFTAPSNAANVTVTASVAGTAKFEIKFKIKEPTGYDHAVVLRTVPFYNNGWGAEAFLRVLIAPTDVSFSRVEIEEVGMDATNVSGRYAVSTPPPIGAYTPKQLRHESDVFRSISCDNRWNPYAPYDEEGDHVRTSMVAPLYAGGYTWPIPANWRIPGGPTNSLNSWSPQVVAVDDNGVTRITKFGIWVERTTNDVYTIGP